MQLILIQQKIYEIKGQKVMLDFDLVLLYGTETRILKQAVKQNLDRFPRDFMFQLNKKEWKELITICDNLPDRIKFSPAMPFAFIRTWRDNVGNLFENFVHYHLYCHAS